MRHVALTVDLEGEEGLGALLSQLGVGKDVVDAALPVIVAECSRRSKRFRHEQGQLARPCPEKIARFLAQRRAPLPDLSGGVVTQAVVQPLGGRWPTKHQAALAKTTDEEERRALEASERKRQQKALAQELRLLSLPIVDMSRGSVDPDGFLELAAGSHRPSTIRVRLQRWVRFRRWLQETVGQTWPRTVVDLVDYLRDVISQEGVARTTPGQIAASVAFMEKAGGIGPADRLTQSPIWHAALRDAEVQLQTGPPPAKQAPRFTLSLIVALETLVVDPTYPMYKRLVAWTRLVKVWAALRSGDTEAIDPASLRWTKAGLEGLLDRTKTSGPGKRIQHLPFYVRDDAFLKHQGWLKVGLDLLASEAAFRRDYLLPRPGPEYKTVVQKMASYSDRAAYGRAVLADAPFPPDDRPSKVTRSAVMYWTEHSERNFLVSAAAVLGFSKEKRDYLGRWRPNAQSDDYLRTSRQVVGNIQSKVAARLRRQPTLLDDSSVTDSLTDFLLSRGVSKQEVAYNCAVLKTAPRQPVTPTDVVESESAESGGESEKTGEGAGETEGSDREGPRLTESFWISSSARRGFRRLHRNGGCCSRPGVKDMVCSDLAGQVFDARCKHCFREDREQARAGTSSRRRSSTSPSASSTTEGSSSSGDSAP